MSVLITHPTVIVQKFTLELNYPGGAGGFLDAVSVLSDFDGMVTTDDPQLVGIATTGSWQVSALCDLLESHGVRRARNDYAGDYVVAHTVTGPEASCVWLDWRPLSDERGIVWQRGSEAGRIAAPAALQSARSQLAPANGGDEWNEETSMLHDEPDQDDASVPSAGRPAIFQQLLDGFAATGWTAHNIVTPWVSVNLTGKTGVYENRFYAAEDINVVVCRTRMQLFIPKKQHRRAMELITRVNYELIIGSFDLDLDDGMLGFRVSYDLENGVMSPEMVANLACCAVSAIDRWYPPLMEVIYGGKAVAAVLAAR
ncbi:MAG: YbjN domain-containing protein [Gemmatimonadaceae bacterium]|nr:YbjN domain-containing protein [Gemmatimonadaceae bacterium]